MDERQPIKPHPGEPDGLPPEETTEGSREDRIRVALGLAEGPLPRVSSRWLRQYHGYLASRLAFPFAARRAAEGGRGDRGGAMVTVVALLDPDKMADREDEGLLCAAQSDARLVELPLIDVEVEPGDSNQQILDDYWYWFWNWRFDPRI